MQKVISTKRAPGAIGPYSQAIEINNMVFTSGVIPVNPATGEIAEGVEAQAEQAFEKEPFPARSCVEVARLPKDVLLEVEAIAWK